MGVKADNFVVAFLRTDAGTMSMQTGCRVVELSIVAASLFDLFPDGSVGTIEGALWAMLRGALGGAFCPVLLKPFPLPDPLLSRKARGPVGSVTRGPVGGALPVMVENNLRAFTHLGSCPPCPEPPSSCARIFLPSPYFDPRKNFADPLTNYQAFKIPRPTALL